MKKKKKKKKKDLSLSGGTRSGIDLRVLPKGWLETEREGGAKMKKKKGGGAGISQGPVPFVGLKRKTNKHWREVWGGNEVLGSLKKKKISGRSRQGHSKVWQSVQNETSCADKSIARRTTFVVEKTRGLTIKKKTFQNTWRGGGALYIRKRKEGRQVLGESLGGLWGSGKKCSNQSLERGERLFKSLVSSPTSKGKQGGGRKWGQCQQKKGGGGRNFPQGEVG